MRAGTVAFWGMLVAATAARLAFSLYQTAPDAGDCVKQAVKGFGTISEDPSMTETGQVLVISADELTVASTGKRCSAGDGALSAEAGSDIGVAEVGGLRIRVKAKPYPRFSYGEKVAFTGRLNRPFNFSSSGGRAFDYRGYLAKDGIYYEMKSAAVRAAGGAKAGLVSALYSLKRHFTANLGSALGEPHAALAAGLVVGEKAALGKDLLDDFRKVGLIHIVVLSGFNITVVAVAMRRTLSFLPRVWGIVIGGLGIILFGLLVGGGATVVRSCFMGIMALTADLIRREYDVRRALAFAALLMLIINPLILLHDPSFQLSFLATIGLVMLAGPIESRLGFIPDKFGARGTIAATLSTQIFVSPYILYLMGQISLVGAFVNILVLPLIPVTMLAVFLTGTAGFILPAAAQIIGFVAHLLLSYELFMVQGFARLPFAAAYVPAFSAWWVAGFYAILIGGYLFFRARNAQMEAV